LTTTIRRTAAATAILVYALIVLGAVVRTTDSGLSCPDWPTCYGHWVPLPSDLEALPGVGYTYGQVMLEWVHRLIAGVLVGPLALALAIMTFLRRRGRPGLAAAGGLLVALLLVQGALGGLTVLDRNSAWSVAVHLGNALLVLTVTLRIFALASGWPGRGETVRPLFAPALAAWCLALLAMTSAAVTAKSGASLACATWPLCNGELVPDLADPFVRVHFLHRLLAAATAGMLLLLLWRSRRLVPAPPAAVRGLVALAAGLVTLQVGLGALVILLGVPVWKAVLHQAVGVLTFAVVTLILWRCAPSPARGAAAGRDETGDRDGLALRGA
jgi:heme a synthase